jgi:hypothetical protein
LVIVQWRVAVAALGIFVAGLAISALALTGIHMAFPKLTDDHPAVVGVPTMLFIAVISILAFFVAPRFAQVRLAADDEEVDYPLSR